MSTIIPEISLISLQNQSESDLKILKEALNTHGFFTIIDHDIDKPIAIAMSQLLSNELDWRYTSEEEDSK